MKLNTAERNYKYVPNCIIAITRAQDEMYHIEMQIEALLNDANYMKWYAEEQEEFGSLQDESSVEYFDTVPF